MSRRNISKKRFPEADSTYNSYLVSLLISRILKSGKKNLAQNIVNGAFDIIKAKTNEDPVVVFERAIRNATDKYYILLLGTANKEKKIAYW